MKQLPGLDWTRLAHALADEIWKVLVVDYDEVLEEMVEELSTCAVHWQVSLAASADLPRIPESQWPLVAERLRALLAQHTVTAGDV